MTEKKQVGQGAKTVNFGPALLSRLEEEQSRLGLGNLSATIRHGLTSYLEGRGARVEDPEVRLVDFGEPLLARLEEERERLGMSLSELVGHACLEWLDHDSSAREQAAVSSQ